MAHNRNQTIYKKVKSYVDSSEGYVVLTRELLPFGSRSVIGKVLKRLVGEEYLIRVSVGVYAKTRCNLLYNERFAAGSLDAMAYETFSKLGIQVLPGWAIRALVEGRSEQIPCRTFIDTMGKNITRKFTLYGMRVYYEGK